MGVQVRKLLWIGDACVATGFARATHKTLEVLSQTWDVTVLGINHRGDPDVAARYPYPIYPCFVGDFFGYKRIADVVNKKMGGVDCIVIQNDVWNIPGYVKTIREAGINAPIVGAIAVDGKNCQGFKLNDLALSIFWTQFGEDEARLGGFTGKAAVVPLGVDLDLYALNEPSDLSLLRQHIRPNLTANEDSTFDVKKLRDSFIVGNVNRNQQRKRMDLTVEYFCKWVSDYDVNDAFLMLHSCPTGEQEYDVLQLMTYYGCQDRLFLLEPDIGQGVSEDQMPWVYRCMDVLISTTQGEGMGLTTMEAMACGIPCIVPRWSALEDWASAAIQIPCSTFAATQNRIGVIGGVPDREPFVEALQALYASPKLRETTSQAGLDLMREPRFRWENIGVAFEAAIDQALCLEPELIACL